MVKRYWNAINFYLFSFGFLKHFSMYISLNIEMKVSRQSHRVTVGKLGGDQIKTFILDKQNSKKWILY